MTKQCPRCRQAVRERARYCARCGEASGRTTEERPDQCDRGEPPLSPPPDFAACDGSPGLYYKWESGWGGPKLLSTESLALLLFNGGSTMNEIRLEIAVFNKNGQRTATIRPAVLELLQGETARIDVPSYELPDDAHTLTVALGQNQPAAQSR